MAANWQAILHRCVATPVLRKRGDPPPLSGEYTVVALGSAPGFGYLHGLDPLLATPRKKVPSLNMLKGTVTIGGAQTGVSVLTGPNGWNAIGFAELEVFDPHAANPALMAPGDSIRFYPKG
jgi:KipI family sensor histidine kinase inhibitor